MHREISLIKLTTSKLLIGVFGCNGDYECLYIYIYIYMYVCLSLYILLSVFNI